MPIKLGASDVTLKVGSQDVTAYLGAEVVSLDPDAASYLASVEEADGESLEPAVRAAIADFIEGCKSDGIWDAIDHCCVLAGARTIAGAIKPLKGTAPSQNAFEAADYDRKTGLIGSTANTKYLDTNVNGNTFTQDDFHMSLRVSAAPASNSYWLMGAGFTGTGASEIFTSGGIYQWRNQSGSSDTFAAAADTIADFVGSSRSESTEFAMRAGTLSRDPSSSRPSDAPFNGNIYVFRTLSLSSLFYPGRIAWYSLGSDVDLALLRTRVNTLLSDIGSAI